MLTYLVKTTESLVMLAIMLGMIFAFSEQSDRITGTNEKVSRRIIGLGAVLGAAASVAMAYAKNATAKVDTGSWNLKIFAVSTLAFVIFMIFSALRKRDRKMEIISWIALSVLTFMIIFYALPDVWAYPYVFRTSDMSVLSTDFLFRFIGYLLGILLTFVGGFSVYRVMLKGATNASKGTSAEIDEAGANRNALILKILLLVNCVKQITTGLQTLLARRIITSNHTLFTIAKFTSNHSNLFVYISMALAIIIPIILWIRSMNVNEPYSNSAQHRIIKAKWRSAKRWSGAVMVVFLICVLNMTVVKAYDSKEVELSPVEDAVVEGENVYVSLEQVEDGHLHRFGYVTDSGIQVRFIVIKKPNSSAYGIGLDACDICGETGYYEKDGQVVCKLCDVVMNINTIGFKGGCNPIVIDYSISNGKIVVPIEGLVEYESEFK